MSPSASSAFGFSIDSAHEQASVPTQAYVPNHPLPAPIPDPQPTTAPLLELQSRNPVSLDSICQDDLAKVNGATATSISNEKLVQKHGSGILSMARNDSNCSFASAPSPVLSLDKNTSWPSQFRQRASGDAAVQATAEESVLAKVVSPHRLQRELLNIQSRFVQQQAEDQSAFDAIKGELRNLTAMASQLAESMGKRSISAATPACVVSEVFGELPTPSSGNGTGTTSPAPSASSTASVTPQVFGEMPTPISEEETHGTASELCSGQHVLIQNSGVNNLSEQNPDGRPQRYGLQNLCVQSIILSDGTELSYFALPTDYPLKQAIPSTSPSAAEQVGAVAPRFVPAHAAVSLTPVCCSETNNAAGSEETKGCSHEFIRVFTATPEQPTKEVEQRQSHQAPMFFSDATLSPKRPVVGTVGVFSLTSDKSTCDLEKLNESDNLFLAKQDTEQPLKFSSDEEFQGNEQLFQEKSVFQSAEGHSISFFLWDPGEHRVTAQNGTEVFVKCNSGVSTPLQLMGDQVESLNTLSRTTPWDPGALVMLSGIIHRSTRTIKDAELLRFSGPISCQLPKSSSGFKRNSFLAKHLQDFSMEKGSLFCAGHTLPWYPWYTVLLLYQFLWEFLMELVTHMPWDPGQPTITMTCEHAAIVWRMVCVQRHCCFPFHNSSTASFQQCLPQEIQLSIILKLIMQLLCVVTEVQVTELNASALLVLFFPCSTYTYCPLTSFETRANLQWDPGILTILDMMLVKYVVPHQLGQNQSVGTGASSIWDPGIDSLLWVYICMHKHMVHLVLNDWELFNQQGVPGNYSAQHVLLFSQNWLQIWDMGTFFTTFLPP